MTLRGKQALFFVGYVLVLVELLQIIHHSLAMAAQGDLAGWWYGSAVLAGVAVLVMAVVRPTLEPRRERSKRVW